MTAYEWCTIILAFAGVISGLAGAASPAHKANLVRLCVLLLISACAVAVGGTLKEKNAAAQSSQGPLHPQVTGPTFSGSPQSTRATPSPPTPTPSPTPTPTKSPSGPPFASSQDAMKFVSGRWKGSVTQKSGSVHSYTTILELTVTPGTAAGKSFYPELNCSGILTLDSVTYNMITLSEVIVSGKQSCMNGTMVLKILDHKRLYWMWPSAINIDAQGTLTRMK